MPACVGSLKVAVSYKQAVVQRVHEEVERCCLVS